MSETSSSATCDKRESMGPATGWYDGFYPNKDDDAADDLKGNTHDKFHVSPSILEFYIDIDKYLELIGFLPLLCSLDIESFTSEWTRRRALRVGDGEDNTRVQSHIPVYEGPYSDALQTDPNLYCLVESYLRDLGEISGFHEFFLENSEKELADMVAKLDSANEGDQLEDILIVTSHDMNRMQNNMRKIIEELNLKVASGMALYNDVMIFQSKVREVVAVTIATERNRYQDLLKDLASSALVEIREKYEEYSKMKQEDLNNRLSEFLDYTTSKFHELVSTTEKHRACLSSLREEEHQRYVALLQSLWKDRLHETCRLITMKARNGIIKENLEYNCAVLSARQPENKVVLLQQRRAIQMLSVTLSDIKRQYEQQKSESEKSIKCLNKEIQNLYIRIGELKAKKAHFENAHKLERRKMVESYSTKITALCQRLEVAEKHMKECIHSALQNQHEDTSCFSKIKDDVSAMCEGEGCLAVPKSHAPPETIDDDLNASSPMGTDFWKEKAKGLLDPDRKAQLRQLLNTIKELLCR